MFSDSDLLPLSALQHFVFCPRQCALIHIEQQWVENRFTAEGRSQHERVDRPEHEIRDGIRYEYAVLLRSLRLGLIGKADVVEFHFPDSSNRDLRSETSNLKSRETDMKSDISKLNSHEAGMKSDISNLKLPVRVFPVEHKRGRPKPTHCDWVQLCAQALCLEEMLNIKIPEGAIFYGLPRRRQSVAFTPELRLETQEMATALHNLIQSGKTPPATYEKKKCDSCSLLEICMPKRLQRVEDYLAETVFKIPDLKYEIPQSKL